MTASSRFITFYVFFFGLIRSELFLVQGDCWYDNKKHAENAEVPTGEPCLNCTCNRSVLLCYLRVCPKLPNPPPPGCILLHRYRTCCPELICNDYYDGGNSVEARADVATDLDDPSDDHAIYKDACILNGSIYSPGSAMHTSSLCEYCYCLAGKQVCVKPKCLLALEGCLPVYQDTSCCPVRYNCSRLHSTTQQAIITTTLRILEHRIEGGCSVNGTHYSEGSKLIGVGHTACDNCYCLGGVVRCEPMQCAPPLLGCTPVIKPGECCAASYNCNGTLEVKSEPNYGLFPTISKHYSKLHKHAQLKPQEAAKSGVVTVAPLYVLPDSLEEPSTNKYVSQRSPETYGTTRQFPGLRFGFSTTEKPRTSSIDQLDEGRYHLISSSNYRSRSTSEKPSSRTGTYLSSSATPAPLSPKKDDAGDFFGSLDFTSILKSLLDVDNAEESISGNPVESLIDTTTTESSSFTTATSHVTTEPTSEAPEEHTELVITTTDPGSLVTVTEILNSTDCINGIDHTLSGGDEVTTESSSFDPAEVNNLIESRTELLSTTTEESSSENLSTEESHGADVKLRNKFKVGGNKLPPDIEAILNISKHKNGEDYDYDYNEPTLPPSLPNLKIIPFLAADALDLKKDTLKDPTSMDKHGTGLLQIGGNIFKPPVETEGGFVPKDPITDIFYDNEVSVPSITSEAAANDEVISCIKEGEEIGHGMPVLSDSPCMTCSCFYGNIACQKIECPLATPGCKLDPEQPLTQCCPAYICDDVIIGQIPPDIVTVAEGIIPVDPFKDVIRTEPAPNLQILIGDMKTRFNSTLDTNSSNDNPSANSRDSLLDLLSGTMRVDDHNNTTATPAENYVKIDLINTTESLKHTHLESPTTTTKSETTTSDADQKSSIGLGLLKLAGCNIYGRMYRVGRIISELSGPCLECKCTEVGVQCKELKCSESSSSN